jgi:hypothetical protein
MYNTGFRIWRYFSLTWAYLFDILYLSLAIELGTTVNYGDLVNYVGGFETFEKVGSDFVGDENAWGIFEMFQ